MLFARAEAQYMETGMTRTDNSMIDDSEDEGSELSMTEGRIEPSLGPSDSSDSPSDVAGQEISGDGDPTEPVDVATRPDGRRPAFDIETGAAGSDTDASGTGERRSAGNDGGTREASDISTDREFDDPAGEGFGTGLDEAEEANRDHPGP